MLNGLLNLPWWGDLLCTLLLTHITIASVTIYLHRHQAHRALDLHPAISHFFRFWLWLTTGMVTGEWVAIHRKHHVECETERDPHSPQVYGIRKVLWEGAELYRAESKNRETMDRYSRGTPNDWLENHVYRRYQWLGLVVMLVTDLALFGPLGLTMWAIQMMWIPFFAAGVINGIGHYWGYRNFECLDASRNIVPWGIIIGGEELHNNHHTFPNSAKLSVKWWEFDIGWAYITLLSWMRLATVRKLPPEIKVVPERQAIDLETVSVLVSSRFQILARYSKEVLLPVLREEKRKAGEKGTAVFRKAKSLLIRTDSLMDSAGKRRLAQLLTSCQQLQQVYQYREKLQSIWEKTAANQKELLEAIQEWCRQAEATGIEVLSDFSRRLKTFVPKTVG